MFQEFYHKIYKNTIMYIILPLLTCVCVCVCARARMHARVNIKYNLWTTMETQWTLTFMHRCLCWRTKSMTILILNERILSSTGNDVRLISIWAAEWTPNTFCTHSTPTFSPIHKNRWMPFSVTTNTLHFHHIHLSWKTEMLWLLTNTQKTHEILFSADPALFYFTYIVV
jgi:hypothetical protein